VDLCFPGVDNPKLQSDNPVGVGFWRLEIAVTSRQSEIAPTVDGFILFSNLLGGGGRGKCFAHYKLQVRCDKF